MSSKNLQSTHVPRLGCDAHNDTLKAHPLVEELRFFYYSVYLLYWYNSTNTDILESKTASCGAAVGREAASGLVRANRGLVGATC
jgi:hypothetical protein